ncbi:hypothetical protein B0H14DRAFT_1179168 [Mycena olivaceomarginata]|nr:hypothetical protein B0H14DRAFT_1179168 [Mycena olivaceomarginata]
MNVPAALISAATAIPVISIYHVHMDLGEISNHIHDSAPAPRLRHLILGDDVGPAIYDFLLHPRNPAYIQQIERLEIRINEHSASYDARIIAACAATLKYLVIDYPADPIKLPLLLSVLEVEIKTFVGVNRRLGLFFSSNLLQVASSLPLVETITLVFDVEPLFAGLEVDWPDEGPLPIFGPSFMDRTQLLHLRRVHCILRRNTAFGDVSAFFDRFVPAMESKMPGLRSRGILKCTLADLQ